jgi:hypothetical protein
VKERRGDPEAGGGGVGEGEGARAWIPRARGIAIRGKWPPRWKIRAERFETARNDNIKFLSAIICPAIYARLARASGARRAGGRELRTIYDSLTILIQMRLAGLSL